MRWKTAHRSFYYADAPEPADLVLPAAETALLCIDVQNYGLVDKESPEQQARWQPFFTRMHETVIPTLQGLQHSFRAHGIDVIHARIACLLEDGRDRSLSQKMPGWNNLLMPRDTEESQIIPQLAPLPGQFTQQNPVHGVIGIHRLGRRDCNRGFLHRLDRSTADSDQNQREAQGPSDQTAHQDVLPTAGPPGLTLPLATIPNSRSPFHL